MHALYSRFEQDPGIELFITCARFPPSVLKKRFKVEKDSLQKVREIEYDAQKVDKILEMIFNAQRSVWNPYQEYVYKQCAGDRDLANELLERWRKEPKRIFI